MEKNKLPNLIIILVLTLITIVTWVSLSVFRALSQKPVPDVAQEVSNPLTPTLDTDSLKKIESRLFLDDSQIPEVKIGQPATPTPKATPVPHASPKPVSSPAPAASPSATP